MRAEGYQQYLKIQLSTIKTNVIFDLWYRIFPLYRELIQIHGAIGILR